MVKPLVAACSVFAVLTAPQDGSLFGGYRQRLGGLLSPIALDIDTAGNHVFEPGEFVDLRPAWHNFSGSPQTLAGALSSFAGPAGPTYSITDPSGDYGTVPDNTTASCVDCYALTVSNPVRRPELHWDAAALETLSLAGITKWWLIHIGATFADVPPASSSYRSIETLVHHGVTSGCSASSRRIAAYCPERIITRAEMTPFLLRAREGPAYVPPACVEPPLFIDVPVASPFCPWIEELARRSVVFECAPDLYCPKSEVRREEIPAFILRTLDPGYVPPPCVPPNLYADVPETSPQCPWIEELTIRGAAVGCGGGNYCPADGMNREQMAVFISAAFALTLYGP